MTWRSNFSRDHGFGVIPLPIKLHPGQILIIWLAAGLLRLASRLPTLCLYHGRADRARRCNRWNLATARKTVNVTSPAAGVSAGDRDAETSGARLPADSVSGARSARN